MVGNAAPEGIVQGLLEGVAPPRPLFLPIVFSHAARIENVPLGTFLANPTKISNSLRQVRARLRSDGVTCYFDPFLESEALGAKVDWPVDDRPPSLWWPEGPVAGESWESRSTTPLEKAGRVPVAVEVIRRLKTMLRTGGLLMAAVTGPLTEAASLAQLDIEGAFDHVQLPESALDLATTAVTGIATAFLEAGASAILIREDFLPAMSEEGFTDWCSRLRPIINIVRFYRALPILVLGHAEGVTANRNQILRTEWDCVVCPIANRKAASLLSELGPSVCGLALAPDMFSPNPAPDFEQWVSQIASEVRPAVITTAGDLPASVDIERLNKLWENLQRR